MFIAEAAAAAKLYKRQAYCNKQGFLLPVSLHAQMKYHVINSDHPSAILYQRQCVPIGMATETCQTYCKQNCGGK